MHGQTGQVPSFYPKLPKLQGAAEKNALKLIAIFSATAWNFNKKIAHTYYRLIFA